MTGNAMTGGSFAYQYNYAYSTGPNGTQYSYNYSYQGQGGSGGGGIVNGTPFVTGGPVVNGATSPIISLPGIAGSLGLNGNLNGGVTLPFGNMNFNGNGNFALQLMSNPAVAAAYLQLATLQAAINGGFNNGSGTPTTFPNLPVFPPAFPRVDLSTGPPVINDPQRTTDAADALNSGDADKLRSSLQGLGSSRQRVNVLRQALLQDAEPGERRRLTNASDQKVREAFIKKILDSTLSDDEKKALLQEYFTAFQNDGNNLLQRDLNLLPPAFRSDFGDLQDQIRDTGLNADQIRRPNAGSALEDNSREIAEALNISDADEMSRRMGRITQPRDALKMMKQVLEFFGEATDGLNEQDLRQKFLEKIKDDATMTPQQKRKVLKSYFEMMNRRGGNQALLLRELQMMKDTPGDWAEFGTAVDPGNNTQAFTNRLITNITGR